MKFKVASLAATFLLGVIPSVCRSQDFSADVVYFATIKPNAASSGTETSAHRSSKLYVSKDSMRLETRGLTGTVLLVNGEDHTAIALFPTLKTYQDVGRSPSQYFRVEDAENACPYWQRAADHRILCEKVGHEVVDGRQTVKYQNKGASDAAIAAVWIDLSLKFVVKWEDSGNGAELRNINEGQQAADLFAVPSSYKVIKPQKSTTKGFSQRSR